tara:strand:- start:127 stop:783 length:657 start_codon:yes stop_codon:yes gene_type:complete
MKKVFICPSFSTNKYGNIIISNELKIFYYFQSLGLSCSSSYVTKKKELIRIAKNFDSLILCGGGNIYEIERKKLNFLRDKFEISLIREFLKRKKPIIAICRGFQLLANNTKNKIVKINKHVRKNHRINILKKNKYIDYDYINSNSFHNYAVKNLNKDFQINGVTNDGSIEIATNLKKKILCMMFHPERNNISKKKIDKTIINFLYGTNNFSSRSRKKN